MPVEVVRWAFDYAQDVAARTGWRASEVYAMMLAAVDNRIDDETIRRCVELTVDARVGTESFADALRRVADAEGESDAAR